jgi:hypothetical protein
MSPRKRSASPKPPPGWKRAGETAPYATVLSRLAAAKREGWPFPLAWASALYDALDGLPAGEFREWAPIMLGTARAWLDAYEDRPSRLASLEAAS